MPDLGTWVWLRKYSVAAVASAMVLWGGVRLASATAVTVTNGDFENPAAADPDGFVVGGPPSWPTGAAGTAGGGVIDPGPTAGPAFVGENNFLFQDAFGDSFANSTQNTSATIQPNTRYTLSLSVGNDQTHLFPTVGNGDNPTDRFLTRLVLIGPNIGLSTSPGVTLVSSTAGTVTPGTVQTFKLVYDTNAAPGNVGTALYIQLFTQGRADNPGTLTRAVFDNVTLDASPVPEPAAAGLLAVGVLGLARRRVR